MVALKGAELLLNGETMMDDDVEDVDDEESESESESEPEEVALAEPAKNAVYNKEGLLEKLNDISWPENVEWIHKLTVDHDPENEIDVNDDLARELAFYTQALDGTRQAFEKLQSMGIPFLRPPDYYAEMVKSDGHMLKVKGKLLVEKKKIEEAEERKKARESKKIAKEVQAQKTKERAKRKKEEIESVKKWRKQRQQSGFARGKDDEMDLAFDAEMDFERTKKKRPGVAPGDRSGGFARKRGNEKGRKKRDSRDSKFGHGGRKGMKKQNTAETTNDFRGFNKGDMFKNKKRKG
ncbi:probable rRNA-processing protein EBP2 homolog [Phoenix dactylifera]|uniref:Probable rRNA-processing protein EBP2 homolog n=1 Tax=Phoenix dactylifera TaxID=42345 RepID=A0A8B7BQ58_PHODC|nr:probable rRNA-processing protein EBP2 homolog [Phoenix dactylifera]XP_008783112.1 probable rRNA-processing protein EBP2 homolog [Phoenix dactylifera]